MPKSDRTPEPMPSKELVLAAIERAERHRITHDDHEPNRSRADERGVWLAVIKEHLGLAPGGWTTIRLRPTWDELKAAGLITQSRRRGFVVWTLTSAGQKSLDAARKAGTLGQLPESPQHRHWREARSIAASRLSQFQHGLQRVLGEAAGLLDAHEQPDSDTWNALGKRLSYACAALESASYCLHEWPEPDDSRADITPPGKDGCRGIRRFDRR
jgi:hypothetical protein